MPSRHQRLMAALEECGAQAFVATTRPNQLYLLDHEDPSTVISRPNCHAILFAGEETTVSPGIWISNACRDLLPDCQVIPCQPGVYVPGLGGARVENMIYVGADGPQALTRAPLDLPMGF